MRKTLLAQIYPTYFATVVACLFALALVATALVRSFVFSTALIELEDLIRVAEHVFFPGERIANEKDADAEIERLFEGLEVRLTLIHPDGTVSADSKATASLLENHATRPEFREALRSGRGVASRRSESIDRELLYLAKAVERNGRTVAVARASMPLPFLREKLAVFYLQIALAGCIILLAAAALAYASVKRISRPLVELGAAARRFGAGELDFRCRVSRPEEIGVLAETMNSMAAELRERIEDVERRRREVEAILSGMAEGVIVLDRELRVVETNAAALRLVPSGTTAGTAVGGTLLEVFRSTELRRMAEEALAGSGPSEGVVTIYAASPRHLQVYAAEIPGREGGGCLLVLHDITRLVRLETVRKDFVANVSHELKTPVTSIKGFVETLAEGALDDPERARRFLSIIARHADRLDHIIDDLLALARLEQQEVLPLETERLPLRPLLENALQVCRSKAEAKNISVTVTCPGSLELYAAGSLLEQAFVNLIDNAVKYSGEGTEIRVEARTEGGETVVDVADRGRGIPAKDLSRIFERFYRVDKGRSRDEGGTGLGLSIVKHVMAVHGGSVSVESREGEGSTFTLRLPTEPSKAPAAGKSLDSGAQ